MPSSPSLQNVPLPLRTYVWAILVAWTAAAGATLVWELLDERNQARDLAMTEARSVARRDWAFLRWYAAHGGVYLPAESPPRTTVASAAGKTADETAPPGERPRILASASDVLREIHQRSARISGVRGRLIGVRPIRAENAADPWEQGALNELAAGKPEVVSDGEPGDPPCLRLVQPLFVEQLCLPCHAAQGYRQGNLLGGISVSVPWAGIEPLERQEMLRRVVGYGGVWFLGVCGVLLGSTRLRRQMTMRRQAEAELREREMQILAAQRVQKHLLPTKAPVLPGFDLAAANFPAEFASGDYYDFIPLPDRHLGIVVADVSGHGLGPALLMASTQAFLRSMAQEHRDLSEILTRANRFLLETIGDDGDFVTLFFGQLDPRTRHFTYASAGHPSGYVLTAFGEVKECLPSTDAPLAVAPQSEFPCGKRVALEPGEFVLLVTDGILEARSTEDVPFGEERLLTVVRESCDRPAAEIIQRLEHAVREFCGRESLDDDVTLAVLKVL
jgi:serine phosphatase RsbU (regulator of sigma subunit)